MTSDRIRHVVVLVCALALLCGVFVMPAGAAAKCSGDKDDNKPAPYMTVSKPASVTVGESFTVDVTAWNYGAPGDRYSTISISAPDLEEVNDGKQVRVLSDTFAYTEIKNASETVWDGDGNPKSAKYLLVEGGTLTNTGWCEGDTRSLSVEFTPEESGTFTIYVRTTVSQGDQTYTYPYPGNHDGTTDQQGFRVKTFEVDVKPKAEVDAAITGTKFESGDYKRGDDVDGSATVKNTGNSEHTYYVGYSLYDPVGKVYNSDAATTVTLEPGESKQVDLEWTVPANARTGAYDARVSVWKESDPDNLNKRLADVRSSGVFSVREEPNIDATITNTDIDDGEYRDGDDVDAGVTVKNTGNRKHTYFVGYSVTDPDGAVYDIPGQTVTLEPGESRRVNLAWTVPEDADAGHYDARVSVWKESDPSNLRTRLADVDRTNQFEVRPQEDVVFTVSKAASMDGFEVEGEPISDATIEMRGLKYTTNEEGKLTVEFPVDDYDYTVTAEGYETETGTLRMTANSGTHYEYISLERKGVETLTVEVVDASGETLAANTYDIKVDGEFMTPDAQGRLRLETGKHTVTVVPTEFGKSQGVERVEKQVTVDGDGASVTLAALPKEYRLSVNVPETGGTVRLGQGDPTASDFSQTYEEGTTVSVTANAAVGYEFDHWEGAYPSGQRTDRSLSVTLRANSSLSPVFTKTQGEVTIVGYDPDPQDDKFSNYTVQRNPDASFDFSSATLPHGVSWSDISPPPGDYNKRNISATGSYPWSAVGQLVDREGSCTATVIEDNHVITAGHCVYKNKTGWNPDRGYRMQFFPGRNGGKRPFQGELYPPVEVEYVQTYKKWVDNRNQAYDIAVLTLNRNVSAETGSFAYKGRPADAPIYGEDWETTAPEDDTGLHTTGYPSDNASFVATGTAQWDMTVVGEGTENCDSTDGCHQIATGTKTNELLYSGHSGGPVWTADDSGRPTLVSVVSSSPNVAPKDWDIPKVELADPRAVRISTGKYSDVGRIVEKGNSVDLKPVAKLTVRPKPATVGEPVTLDASGSFVPDSSIESYKWDFDPSKGSGIDRITSTPKVTHTYTEESTVSPNVGVVSDEGQFATASTEVTIESASTPTPSLSELDVTIESISTCGTTCRRVSYRVENPTNTTIRDVQVAATITSGDQTVWTKQQTFDEISPGSNAFTSTVNLDAAAALVVQENDRQVTVTIEVTAGDETRTFTYERTV